MKRRLFVLPIPSTQFGGGGASLVDNEIRFEYQRGGAYYRGALRFKRVCATRTRNEPFCTLFHLEDAYDTLVEIAPSPWLEEVRRDSAAWAERYRDPMAWHHYMVYLDSSGCFEVIAEGWEQLPEKPGRWSTPRAPS